MKPKPYALLICRTLRVATFDHESQLLDAITALRVKSQLYVPLRWNAGTETYVPQDVLE